MLELIYIFKIIRMKYDILLKEIQTNNSMIAGMDVSKMKAPDGTELTIDKE